MKACSLISGASICLGHAEPDPGCSTDRRRPGLLRNRGDRSAIPGYLRMLAVAGWLLFPLAAVQGLYVRLRTPRLPGAPGRPDGASGRGGAKLRLLVVGESTTAGVGAPDQEHALAGAAASALAALETCQVHWQALGEIGYKAHEVRSKLLAHQPSTVADAVIIALGVNDTIGFSRAHHWRRELAALIRDVRVRTGPAPVFVSAVPPLGRFPLFPRALRWILGIRAQLLDAHARKLAQAMTDVIHVPVSFNGERELLCADGFHPSAAGYRQWGEQLAAAIHAWRQKEDVSQSRGHTAL